MMMPSAIAVTVTGPTADELPSHRLQQSRPLMTLDLSSMSLEMAAHPTKSVQQMDEWARQTGIPLTSAEALGTLYARAHGWLSALKSQLVKQHGWHEKSSDPRMLFTIECTPPFRSSGGLPRTPPLNLQLPVHASTFFSPERRTQWQMVFHSALFPVMRHMCQPVGDMLNLLQCLLTGMIVLVKEEEIPGDGIWKTTRGLPPPEWISANEANRLLLPLDRQLSAYRFAQVRVIEPEEEFSDTLEFDPAKIRRAIDAGRAAVDREWTAIERLLR